MNANLSSALQESMQCNANKLALDDGIRQLSYLELHDCVSTLACWFKESRISRLGIYCDNRVEWIIVDLAALMSRVTLIPLPGFFSNEQLRHVIDQTKPNQTKPNRIWCCVMMPNVLVFSMTNS